MRHFSKKNTYHFQIATFSIGWIDFATYFISKQERIIATLFFFCWIAFAACFHRKNIAIAGISIGCWTHYAFIVSAFAFRLEIRISFAQTISGNAEFVNMRKTLIVVIFTHFGLDQLRIYHTLWIIFGFAAQTFFEEFSHIAIRACTYFTFVALLSTKLCKWFGQFICTAYSMKEFVIEYIFKASFI